MKLLQKQETFLAAVLAVLLVLSLARCGKEIDLPTIPTPAAAATTPGVTPSDPVVVPPPPVMPPPVTPSCTLSQAGTTTQTHVTGTANGQPIDVVLHGSVTCTDGNPDLFALTQWQWTTYCINNPSFVSHVNQCNITLLSLSNFQLTTQITGLGYTEPTFTDPIPASDY